MGAPSDFDRGAWVALSRVGVDEVAGFLQWGMVEWRSEALPSETVPADHGPRPRRTCLDRGGTCR
jgi:hypothetical protein